MYATTLEVKTLSIVYDFHLLQPPVGDDPLGATDCSTNGIIQHWLLLHKYIYSFRENSCRVNPQSRQTRHPS